MTKVDAALAIIGLTNLCLVFVSAIAACIDASTLENLPIILRQISLFLHHQVVPFAFGNLAMMLLVAFINEQYDEFMKEQTQELSKKYMLQNQSNTKSRLELIKLKERG